MYGGSQAAPDSGEPALPPTWPPMMNNWSPKTPEACALRPGGCVPVVTIWRQARAEGSVWMPDEPPSPIGCGRKAHTSLK